MTDEKMYLLADALEAYFAGEIKMQDVEDYTAFFIPTADQKVKKKKKYFDSGFNEVTPEGEENPEAVGWYERDYIRRREFDAELNRLTCHHPRCNEYHPCRTAMRRSGGAMCCTALTDTEFVGYACPFFRTEVDFQKDFWRTYTAEKPIITKGHIRQIIRIKTRRTK